ncbi:hypothetical protein AXF42_Ash002640 [Apostasia shenzhenica]|uniref:Uncharacterized protein n=1 Tax=Apostasia shenzhenica TaxID=1088818 RepID=A0A2I0AP89_9ASPA|nr:hypothetical protein AXF42_Ash002640 [Apostasia shenzhenica]
MSQHYSCRTIVSSRQNDAPTSNGPHPGEYSSREERSPSLVPHHDLIIREGISFRGVDSYYFYNKLEKCRIAQARGLRFKTFLPSVRAIIARQGWESFIYTRNLCYPRVVREFYANLKIAADFSYISSIFRGVEVTITREEVIEYYGFARGDNLVNPIGHSVNVGELSCMWHRVGRRSAPTTNSKGNLYWETRVKLIDCSTEAKILARILQENLIQIGGHKGEWTYVLLLGANYLLQGYILDTSTILFQSLHDCLQLQTKRKIILHHGNIVCELLESLKGFNLREEEPRKFVYSSHQSLLPPSSSSDIPSSLGPMKTNPAPSDEFITPSHPPPTTRSSQPSCLNPNAYLQHGDSIARIERRLGALEGEVQQMRQDMQREMSTISGILNRMAKMQQQIFAKLGC